jgi:hypothetical protein
MEPVAGQGAERGSSRRGLPGTARTWSRTSEPQRNPFVAWEASGRAASPVWQTVPAGTSAGQPRLPQACPGQTRE